MMTKYNLTQSQYLMWMGQRLDPDLPLYNMAFTFKLNGEINQSAFKEAFQILVNQTDALRLLVEVKDEVPYQSVIDSMEYDVELVDFSEVTDPQVALESWQAQRSAKIFDLSQVLFDSVLIKLSDNQFVWYLNQHHLITDIWSSSLIYKRMADLYQLVIEGTKKKQSFPAYQDYIAYEHRFRESPQFKKIENYWSEKLADPLEPTRFFDEAVENKTARTQRFSYTLNQQQAEALNTLVNRPDIRSINNDLTKFSLFSALLFLLMYQLDGKESEQKKLTIGTPFHNRPTTAFKDTVGLFIEVGVLQIDVSPEETLLSLVKQIQADGLMGLRYAQAGSSSAEMNSAYDVLLNYIHVNYGDFAGLPMESEWIHSGYGDRHHNLRLQVHDHDQTGSFVLHFDLNSDVFTTQQCEWFVQHFILAFDVLVTDPTQSIQDVRLLTSPEWQTRISDFNATQVDYSENMTVISLFEEQVKKTPEAIALVLNKQQISYQELNKRANQVANRLEKSELVGLLVERSIEAIVGILGILKAGSAYVPIDTITPAERIAFILTDAQVSVLLTQQKFRHQLSDVACDVLCLDSDWESFEQFPIHPPKAVVSPNDLAYVIYTSGSTGQPKGVMIPHKGLVHYVRWAKGYYLKEQSLDFPLYSSLAFDLTITSIFTPLVSGGKLVIYPEDPSANGLEILAVIEDNAVDIIKLTPAHLGMLKEYPVKPSRVKQLILGGEDFKTDLARGVHHHFNGQVAIYNEYGPTETVVGCMIHQYDTDLDRLASVPIGRPIDNTQIYILDENLNPTPTGVIGEIYIAGDGVGRGYLNQDKLTKDCFLNNPFTPDSRMYRSGDLARWISEDQLEFLGRVDSQVKIKGYRIELNEIATTLRKHAAINKAVVDVVRYQHSKSMTDIQFCTKCGLPSNYPEASFNSQGVCNTCQDFEAHKAEVESYFRTIDDLQEVLVRAKARKTGKYDCLALLSGGKDSTYMLCQLVELGFTPLVFSLDNGYISESAKANIKRITEGLGVDHIWGSTPDMNTIFRDSLQRFSNVCQGCFKTIYTLSFNLAQEKGIKYIVTGLSRGQLFETRLSDTFNEGQFDAAEIDQVVLDARKVYHRIDDAVSKCLDTRIFDDDAVFEEIQFIDFYCYTDVHFDEMYDYLTNKTPWERPKDTGRSTNCLINDLGIYIHQKEQGYHNYALPYSWDVRIGHKDREEALHELDDEIDLGKVAQMLKEVGYDDPVSLQAKKQLTAYYVSQHSLDPAELKAYMKEVLPEYMVPKQFFALDEIPLTQNGKVDHDALLDVAKNPHTKKTAYVSPQTPKNILLADIWSSVLQMEKIGINDNFFDLGGDSISSIQIITKAKKRGLQLEPKHIFEHQTIAELAKVAIVIEKDGVEQTVENKKLDENKSSAADFPLADLDGESFDHLADVLNQLEEKGS